jgi:pimeloyl-ACP methyl ester carboxylesterase
MTQPSRTGGAVRIAYDRRGAGPLVVFLHGIGGNRSNWSDQLAHLSARYCAVAWDARGYGASDDSPTPLVFGDFADDLARLLDHLGAARAHIVGLSMGGIIAQDFDARFGERVATLTLANTTSGLAHLPRERIEHFLTTRLAPLEAGRTTAEMGEALLAELVGPYTTPEQRERLYQSLAALRVEPYKQALRAIMTTDFRPHLPHIAVPTLVVTSAHDQVVPPPVSEMLAEAIPGSTLASIPRAGHLSNIDQPDLFNQIVGGFLDQHAGRATVLAA